MEKPLEFQRFFVLNWYRQGESNPLPRLIPDKNFGGIVGIEKVSNPLILLGLLMITVHFKSTRKEKKASLQKMKCSQMFSKKWDIFQAFSQRNIAKTRDRKAESGNRCCFSLHKIGWFSRSVLKCSQTTKPCILLQYLIDYLKEYRQYSWWMI